MRERPTFHQEFGDYVRGLRVRLNTEHPGRWTLRGAADMAHRRGLKSLTRQILFRLEQGQTRHPDANVLMEAADLYGVPYAELVARYLASEYGLHVAARDLSDHAGTAKSPVTKGDSSAVELAAATREIIDLKRQLSDYQQLYTHAANAASELARGFAALEQGAQTRSPERQLRRPGRTPRR